MTYFEHEISRGLTGRVEGNSSVKKHLPICSIGRRMHGNASFRRNLELGHTDKRDLI